MAIGTDLDGAMRLLAETKQAVRTEGEGEVVLSQAPRQIGRAHV